MAQTFSVIIVNWNGLTHLKPLFDSMEKMDFPKASLETIMVDNASTDESVPFVKKNFPSVRVIQLDKNYGFCRGNNEGIKVSKGEFILLLNNDTVADKNLLNALLEPFKDPGVAAVGGKVYEWNEENPAFNNGNRISSSWPKVDPYTAKPFNFTDERQAGPVDYLPGCMMVVRKSVVEEIGALDEGYGAYFEETDWCARIIRAGYTVYYAPGAMIWHRVAATSKALSNDFNHRMMARNRIRFAIKNFDLLFLALFVIYYPLELCFKSMRVVYLLVASLANANRRPILAYYSRDLALSLRAVAWNLVNLPATISVRFRDIGKTRKRRSYNRNLPLAGVKPNRRDL